MKIAVCGDSWMSPSFENGFIGTHFAELLCKEQDWQLEYYARPGASNGFICLQIEQAIKDKCDIILFGTTTYNRIEYALNGSNLDPSHQWEGCKEINITHIAPPSLTIRHEKNNYELISDNLMNILGYKQNFINYEKYFMNTPDDDIEIKYKALKDWFTFLYHPAWKQKVDRWCLEATFLKLKNSNIPYVFVIDFVGIPDCDYIDTPVLGEEYASHKYIAPDASTTYHTSKEIQVKILHLVKERLKEKGIRLV
jgi:hypothetical protein